MHRIGLLWGTRINRQSEMKCNSRPSIGCKPQSTALRFNDRTADRQAHTSALTFGSKEGLKNVLRILGLDSFTGIDDRNHDETLFRASGHNPKGAGALQLLHRFQPIEY